MSSNFTDQAPFASNEVSGAINFCLSNQNQHVRSRNYSERPETTNREYESLPFASTETTFSTNPFLPRMTDPAGLSSSWRNNTVGQNDQPTYLPSSYDSLPNMETLALNSSRNSLSTSQNLGLASSSSHLSQRMWGQPGQISWVSNSVSLPSYIRNTRTTEWDSHLSNQFSDPNSSNRNVFTTRANNLGAVSNSWTNSSNGQYNEPMYLVNNGRYFGQPQLNPNSISGSLLSSSPSVPPVMSNNQFNQIRRAEINPRTETPDPADCVVITTVKRRYIYGEDVVRREEPNTFDFYAAGPSNVGPMFCRNNGIGINRHPFLQSRSYCQGRCSQQFRSHPYMPIVSDSHHRQLNLEINSERLATQIANQSPVFRLNRGLPPFESLNLPSVTREINGNTTWVNPVTINNPFVQYSTNNVANRRMPQAEEPFSIDLTVDEPTSVDNLRPSISFTDMESSPNSVGTTQTGSNYSRCERIENNISNLSHHNSVNNSTHTFIPHHSSTDSVRNTVLGTTTCRSSLDSYENQRRVVQNYLRQQRQTSTNATRTTRRQTENISSSQSTSTYSAAYRRKLESFKSQLKPPVGVPKNFEVKIKRSNIFEDSYRVITAVKNVENLKAKLWIVFEGEAGLDYGGLQREWFYLLSREIFNPNYGLFEYCTTSNYSLQINPNSGICNEEHLNYFMFIGRIVGMAVYHEKLLDASFTQIFYRMLIQKKITLEHVKKVDPQYYETLSWISKNDPTHLDLDFSVNEERLGQVCQVELITNGAKIPVKNQNKHSYINHFINWMFVSRVKDQMEAFLMGFHDLIPRKAIKAFSENELESLFCGIQQIDIKDWKTNTVYSGGYHSRHITIKRFWKLVTSFKNEMRAKLLQFVTGTSRVPMNGFKELIGSNGPLLFTIQKTGTTDSLPRAHTCFNRLDLPPYENFEQLKDKLICAIEGCEGFDGVD